MSTIQLAVTALAVLFGIAGAMGGAVGVFFATRSKSTIETQAANIGALETRVNLLELSEEDCKKALGEAKGQMKALTELVTQAAAVQALDERLQLHDEEVGVLWKKVNTRLGLIEKAVKPKRGK